MADNFATGVVQLANANVLSGTVDPSAGGGVTAPLGSVYCLNIATAGQVFLKVGAADTDWTPWTTGGGGGGDLILVDEQTVAGAAVSTITFGGLDGEADGVYEIAFHLKRAAATINDNSRVLLLPNGLTSNAAGVFTQWPDTSAESQIENNRQTISNGMTFKGDPDDVWGFIKFWAARDAAGTPHFRTITSRCCQASEDGGTPLSGDFRRWWWQGYWRDTATNVTSIELLTATAAEAAVVGWDIGSTAQLWKRPF